MSTAIKHENTGTSTDIQVVYSENAVLNDNDKVSEKFLKRGALVYIGTCGVGDTIKVRHFETDAIQIYKNPAAGMYHPWRVTQIFDTDTTCSDIVLGN